MRDSSSAEFWNQRYAGSQMPWDFGGVPRAVSEFLEHEPAGKVLIPGCGTGYEVRAFAQAGWTVDAVDFSQEAVKLARDYLSESEAHLVREIDFFAPNPNGPFDLIYERTFLCSLPLNLWPLYSKQVSSCLRPQGMLAGFFFFGPETEPPPYPLGSNGLTALLGSSFQLVEDLPVVDSLSLFAEKERWQVWRKE